MGAEKGFFWRGLVEVHWDNCKCAFIAKNLNQSGTKVEVTVTFVSGGEMGVGGVRLNPSVPMNHCTPNVAED